MTQHTTEKDVPLTEDEIDRLNSGENVRVMLDDGTDLVLHEDTESAKRQIDAKGDA